MSASEKIVAGARAQRGDRYTPGYVTLRYPNGDVPRGTGVCTDVVIRALRVAGYDLQRLVHDDMRRAFSRYPDRWGLRRPDPNIDHRRVPNLQVFFTRKGRALPTNRGFTPGDIVTWDLPGGLTHIGIVSDRNAGRVPLILHNIGPVCSEENVLFAWPITGHFRFPATDRA
jgi:uncharacterized protein YijF (DUF1287 family)